MNDPNCPNSIQILQESAGIDLKTKPYKLFLGDCREKLKEIPANTVDAVVSDPPYELGFMGKSWDASGIAYSVEMWKEVLRVMKPGAHILAFSGTRTYHRMVVAMEDAGFEIRDQLQWIYGSGFPKSLDVSKAVDKCFGKKGKVVGRGGFGSTAIWQDGGMGNFDVTEPESDAAKQWKGWGTALKPANEPIVLARKPLEKSTVAKNVLKYGTGALNIDAGRIGTDDVRCVKKGGGGSTFHGSVEKPRVSGSASGRFPSNVLLDETAAKMLDEMSGNLGKSSGGNSTNIGGFVTAKSDEAKRGKPCGFGDSGGASRFFYTAKTSKWERNYGCEGIPKKFTAGVVRKADTATMNDGIGKREHNKSEPSAYNNNHHPTVKPFTLMRYLVNLITPPGGIVLDPFLGSGTTGAVSVACGFKFIGIEKEPQYYEIAKSRIESVKLNPVVDEVE